MWGKARKKPVVIEYREVIPNALGPSGGQPNTAQTSDLVKVELIETREGKLYARPSQDFIIKGVRGEIYPIGRDIFYETYDVIEEPHSSEQKAKQDE